jgi:hypothetical protein
VFILDDLFLGLKAKNFRGIVQSPLVLLHLVQQLGSAYKNIDA